MQIKFWESVLTRSASLIVLLHSKLVAIFHLNMLKSVDLCTGTDDIFVMFVTWYTCT